MNKIVSNYILWRNQQIQVYMRKQKQNMRI